jgi:hypothetical protein
MQTSKYVGDIFAFFISSERSFVGVPEVRTWSRRIWGSIEPLWSLPEQKKESGLAKLGPPEIIVTVTIEYGRIHDLE